MHRPELFTLDDVSLEIDGRRILDGVDEHLHDGVATAIAGPSGSGKSTLLRLLNRLAEPTSGRVLFRGTEVRDLDVLELRRRAVLVPQRATALTDDVAAEVRVAAPDLTDAQVRALLERVALDPGDFLGRVPSSLSGGELQRLCLARALAVGPEVLLLDEPTSALDPRSADAVDAVIRALVDSGLAVVLVSHDVLRAGRVADDVRVLHGGRVTARGPAVHLDLEHELMSPPADGHVHDVTDPRSHGAAHLPHEHEREDEDEHAHTTRTDADPTTEQP
ncbi:MAG TPA: ATP-binding cassette domain-containing protein [Candidatus Nanopelagicales bacterium]